MRRSAELSPVVLAVPATVLAVLGWVVVDGLGTGLLRLIAILSVSVIGIWACRSGRAFAVISPAYLLAAQALLFFSLLPAALAGFESRPHIIAYAGYLGGRAEGLILVFAILAAATAAWTPRPSPPIASGDLDAKASKILLAWAGLGFGATLFATTVEPDDAANLGYWPRQILDAVMPSTGFALALLHVRLLPNVRRHALFMAVAAVAAAALVLTGRGKFVFFLMGGVAVSWVLFSPAPRLLKATLLPSLLVVGAVGIAIFGFIRDPGVAKFENVPLSLARALAGKIVVRQIETGGCLKNVLAEHWQENRPGRGFDFLVGVVPRAIWPDKPSLSTGAEFGSRYCGLDKIFFRHSASVTLLGEPVIQAGAVGFAIALISLLTGLAVFGWIAAHLGRTGLGMSVALVPWLVDFDQSLSMYLGNGVKALAFGLPLLVLVWWLDRRQRKTPCAA